MLEHGKTCKDVAGERATWVPRGLGAARCGDHSFEEDETLGRVLFGRGLAINFLPLASGGPQGRMSHAMCLN